MTPALLVGACVWLLVPPRAARRLERVVGREASVRRSLPVPIVAGLLTPLAGGLVLGWPWGGLAGLGAAPVVVRLVRRLDTAGQRRRDERTTAQLPAALDLVAAALEGGRPPSIALRLAADATPPPLGDDLSAVARRLEASGDVRAALDDVPSSLASLARALRRADETGVPVAQVVDGVASDLRRSRLAARREAARRVGVRATAPLGLCFLPAFFLIGIVPTLVALAGTLQL